MLCAGLFLSTSCALRPDWQRLAADGNLHATWIDSGRFRHLQLRNDSPGSYLRIYVDGDGMPWIRENRVSIDPTPADPVLLRLMYQAEHPAVYLGRPCYFGTATSRECEPRWWTFDRYGQTVVGSMCDAANRIARDARAEEVHLIGFSGGGAIVLGMRGCTERLVAVTTIAGNLDPRAWAEHHGYSPLAAELLFEPAMASPHAVIESHWQCRDDRNVPPAITDGYFEARPAAGRHIVGSCTHSKGWQAHWQRIVDGSRAN